MGLKRRVRWRGPKKLNLPLLWRHPQKNWDPNLCNFLKIETSRLSASFEDLNSSPAQSAGELWLAQIGQIPVVKGFGKRTRFEKLATLKFTFAKLVADFTPLLLLLDVFCVLLYCHFAGAFNHSSVYRLQHLSLRNNKITDKGAELLSMCLGGTRSQNRYLSTLNLSFNHIGDKGAVHIAQVIKLTVEAFLFSCFWRHT